MENTKVEDIPNLSDKQIDELMVKDNVTEEIKAAAIVEHLERKRLKEEEIVDNGKENIGRILDLLEKIAQNPGESIIKAVLIAILIGVATNVISELLSALFKFIGELLLALLNLK